MLEAVSVSCVINFRLESVTILNWLSSEVVVHPACTLTTTSTLRAADSARVGCYSTAIVIITKLRAAVWMLVLIMLQKH